MRRLIAILLLALLGAGPGFAAAPVRDILIGYIRAAKPDPTPLSLVDAVATDIGIAGAKLGLMDDNATGRFVGQHFALREIAGDAAPEAIAAALNQDGIGLVIADLDAQALLALADQPGLANALIFNVRATDDRLRSRDCRANLFHLIPSRAMLADALAQYLVAKRWGRWVLIAGTTPPDRAFAAAILRSAAKFGAKIVAKREYQYTPGARRSDIGVQQIARQMTQLTQRLPDHDVLVVADESEVFGEYLPYRNWDARPVVGSHGLVAAAWHRSFEQWGATQLQRRFTRLANRPMLERDYAAWLSLRAIGEAATRTQNPKPDALRRHILSDDFALAGFKGVGLNFRRWNQQLRQPILLAQPRMLVAVSPQEEFLHQRTPLDSLGFDQPDSQCHLDANGGKP